MQDIRDAHNTRREHTISKILTRHARVHGKYFQKSVSKGFTFVKKHDTI